MFILLASKSETHLIRHDHLCNATRHVLCVQEILEAINKTAQRIHTKAIITKNVIRARYANMSAYLDRYIAIEENNIDGRLPNETFHAKLIRMNNINMVCCS